MSDALLETVTKEAISLPYEEQRELLNSISVSIRRLESKPRRNLDFDSYVIPCERANCADQHVSELRSNDRI